MEKLKAYLEDLKKTEITYDYEDSYHKLYNLGRYYEDNEEDYLFCDLWEEYIDYDLAETLAKHELETGGLIRLYYFMSGCNFNNEIYRLNVYGNLEDISKEDLECLKQEMIDRINKKIEDLGVEL